MDRGVRADNPSLPIRPAVSYHDDERTVIPSSSGNRVATLASTLLTRLAFTTRGLVAVIEGRANEKLLAPAVTRGSPRLVDSLSDAYRFVPLPYHVACVHCGPDLQGAP